MKTNKHFSIIENNIFFNYIYITPIKNRKQKVKIIIKASILLLI